MISKGSCLKKISDAVNIMSKYGLENTIAETASDIERMISGYAFRVVMTGSFSSGKSAFLNRLLDRELLAEAQGPETSVPAELVWGESEFAEAVFPDGRSERIEFEAISTPPEGAAFLVLHVNSAYLRDHPDLILVDFPGLGSNVEAHNRAITNYIQRGSAFVLLTSSDSGTLNESVCAFLREVSHYPQGLACFVTKSDLLPREQVDAVVEQVRGNISSLYGSEVPVDSVSKFEYAEPDFMRKVTSALDRFHPQELFELTMSVPVNAMLRAAISTLRAAADASGLDLDELNAEISACERRCEEIRRKFADERRKLDKKYRDDVIKETMSAAKGVLYGNCGRLASAALSGQQSFAAAVSELLRPVMFEMPEMVRESVWRAADRIAVPLPDASDGRCPPDTEKMRLLIEETIAILGRMPSKSGGTDGRKKAAVSTASAVGTSVAVAAGAITPWAGVALMLVPVAMDAIALFTGKASEEDRIGQARQNIESQVIPQILARVEDSVSSYVTEAREKMMEELTARVNEVLAAEESALVKARSECAERRADFDSRMNSLRDDISKLESLIMPEV